VRPLAEIFLERKLGLNSPCGVASFILYTSDLGLPLGLPPFGQLCRSERALGLPLLRSLGVGRLGWGLLAWGRLAVAQDGESRHSCPVTFTIDNFQRLLRWLVETDGKCTCRQARDGTSRERDSSNKQR